MFRDTWCGGETAEGKAEEEWWHMRFGGPARLSLPPTPMGFSGRILKLVRSDWFFRAQFRLDERTAGKAEESEP